MEVNECSIITRNDPLPSIISNDQVSVLWESLPITMTDNDFIYFTECFLVLCLLCCCFTPREHLRQYASKKID